jgi:hypothetical protein
LEKPLRSFLRLVLVLAVALPLFAQVDGFRVDPPAPTTDTPITVTLVTTCFLDAGFSADTANNVVTVLIEPRGSCPSPPLPVLRSVAVGKLPAGTYELKYRFGGTNEVGNTGILIHVRPAPGDLPFEIRPSAVRMDPAGLQLRVTSDETICVSLDCSDIIVRIGGLRVLTPIRREDANTIWFEAPPRPIGPVGLQTVVIEKTVGNVVTWTAPHALLYFNGPDLGAFERILFPTLFDAPGVNGSQWVAEGAISNPNPYFVENYNSLQSIVCVTYPCGERLSPHSFTRLTQGRWPEGIILFASRVEAPTLHFALRVRDISRQAEGFGTEIPVVREKDMFVGTPIRLLDVPLDSRYRVKLRVYAYGPIEIEMPVVTISDAGTGAVKSRHPILLKSSCNGCPTMPWYAELDLPAGKEGDRVNITVGVPLATPAWAFATVTNNETQQVTVVSPQ